MSFPRRSIKGLSRVEYKPMKEITWAVLKHKKGDKYVDWDLKFPFRHVKEYEENIYIDTDFFMRCEYSESYLLKNFHIILLDGKLYDMCSIKCVFLDGEDCFEYFTNDNAGIERYNYLCKQFDLKLFDNK